MKWIFLLVSFALFSTEQMTLKREDGSELIAYFEDFPIHPYSIVLLIPGSQKETSLKLHLALKEDLLGNGFCPVTLEKRGILGETIQENEFNQYLSFNERLADHLLLAKNLKANFPGWSGKLALIGQGDGGRIGAHFAAKNGHVDGIALIASGGGWDPLSEILYSFRSAMAEDGYSPQYIHGFLVQAKEELARACAKPKWDQKAFGYPYKYWESFLNTHLAEDLSKITCPIYSINGVNDDRVPIESVVQLSKFLESRMILSRKEQIGREILQDKDIYKEAITWLSENL